MCAANERVARRKTTFCSRCPCCLAILALVLAVLVLAAILDAATAPTAPSPSAPLVLCALFSLRYEAPYLLPWLAYHRMLGFDRVILYHDDVSGMFSADLLESHSKLLQLLQRKAAQSGSWLTMKSMAAMGIKRQREQLRDCNREARRMGARWAGNWDIDEALAVGGVHASAGWKEFYSPGIPSPLPLADVPNFIDQQLNQVHPAAALAIPRSEYMLTYDQALSSELPPHNLQLEFERYTARLRGLTFSRGNKATFGDLAPKLMWRPSERIKHNGEANHGLLGVREEPCCRIATTSAIGHRGHSSIPVLRLYHYHDRSYGECVRKAALSMHRIGANGYYKDQKWGHLAGNLSTRYDRRRCAQTRDAVNSTAFRRHNDKSTNPSLNDFVIGTSLAHADFMRDESIAVHAASVREAITLEFGPGALRVLRDSQAWFRERVRRFLEEGADPAF